ncbi:MAG TPA: NAD(+) diphosphatase, partial [Thermomicrobiales bacterium]|nr:NAD(+) diphosphatase [Thermomicrobiales bacterium]
SCWFAFRGADLLVIQESDAADPALPQTAGVNDLGLAVTRRQYLGRAGSVLYWSAELAADIEPSTGGRFVGLRTLYDVLPDPLYALAGRAAQIVAWDRDHQFCGRCGAPTEPSSRERARRCPRCGLLSFPRISPAVITLIERDERILLARSPHFAPGRFGIIAGFVEPGESLEDAVRREVREEVGIEIGDLRYFGSQPWPFPHGIMLGFTAKWAAGELTPDPAEISEAGWYGIGDLPQIPQKMSIARRLIDDWARRRGWEIPEDASWR